MGAGASIASFSVNKSGDAVFKVGSNTLTLKKVGSEDISTNGKKVTVIENSATSTRTYFKDRILTDTSVTLGAAFADKTFTADSKLVTIDASQVSILSVLNGNALANVITGGKKADTLKGSDGNDMGGAGNDTLNGGNGADIFICETGKDVISDYAAEDKISLGAAVDNASVKGSNVVLTSGSNTLTVKNAKGKQLTLIDSTGSETSSILGGTGKDKLKSSDGNDVIIYGGAGNDTLSGGNGADILICEAGKDVIYGFGDDDLLEITGLTGAVAGTFNDACDELTVKVGSTEVAMFKDFTASTFNVNLNGGSYTIKK